MNAPHMNIRYNGHEAKTPNLAIPRLGFPRISAHPNDAHADEVVFFAVSKLDCSQHRQPLRYKAGRTKREIMKSNTLSNHSWVITVTCGKRCKFRRRGV